MIDALDSIALFKKLLSIESPPGSERSRGEAVARLFEDKAFEMSFDPLGNLIARKRGSGRKVMICARLDSAGVIAKHVDKDGCVHVMPLGNLNTQQLLGSRVRFENGLSGILVPAENDIPGELIVDLGSPEAVMPVGCKAVFSGEAIYQGDLVMGPSCGSVATCVAALLAVKILRDVGGDISFVFAAQGEIEQRGVKAAAYALSPELGILLDVSESPRGSAAGRVKLGQGPAVIMRDQSAIYPKEVSNVIELCANRLQTPIQREVREMDGGETAGGHLLSRGIMIGAIGIPVKYRLSANEIVNIRDVESAAKILATTLLDLAT